jgi:hypothetical protein
VAVLQQRSEENDDGTGVAQKNGREKSFLVESLRKTNLLP